MYLGDVKRFERSLLAVIKHWRKGEALAPERDHELLALGLDRLQQLRLRAVHEARRQSLRHERSFHPADQRAVKFRGRKGREIEGLAGPVGEHDFARLQIEITNEKAGFLDSTSPRKCFNRIMYLRSPGRYSTERSKCSRSFRFPIGAPS